MLLKLLEEAYAIFAHLKSTGFLSKPTKKPRTRGPETKHRRKGYKLYPEEVLVIYNSKKASIEDLCKAYGVSPTTVYAIKSGATWSKLTGHKK